MKTDIGLTTFILTSNYVPRTVRLVVDSDWILNNCNEFSELSVSKFLRFYDSKEFLKLLELQNLKELKDLKFILRCSQMAKAEKFVNQITVYVKRYYGKDI